ncbi:DUF6779 domain-containing protein [Rhodococcoides fascians]|uniref:DUF6779 domain-containing protein n=1 Tax=Rhodococcoides fascians TaxID=1828 RepID=UPI000690EDB1|nr:DUF6779 domain-containing protein [Rhodococcus fascians]
MTEPTRAKAARRSRRSASQLFIAALVVFGVAASVLLLFSENVQWLRVGLVSALWAAIVGAFAMTKYRREAAADQTKAKDLQTVYELQLAREISARREYELGVEARVRSEVQLETSEVAALRAELAHLRENLQMLFDGNLPTERVALRAEATRVAELGGGRNYDGYQPAPSGLYIPGRTGANEPDSALRDPRGQRPSAPVSPVQGIANPYDEPVTAETSVLYPDVPIGSEVPLGYTHAPTSQAPAPQASGDGTAGGGTAGGGSPVQPRRGDARAPGGGRRVPTPPRASAAPSAYPEPSPEVPVEAEYADVVHDSPAEVVPEPQSQPEPEPEPQPEVRQHSEPEPQPEVRQDPEPESPSQHWDLPDPEPRSRRRRRAEPEDGDTAGAHSNGRSVAEIMAGLQSGSGEPTERRHRRRAD